MGHLKTLRLKGHKIEDISKMEQWLNYFEKEHGELTRE
jgi:hypothetical protein